MENKKYIIEKDAQSLGIKIEDLEPSPFNSYDTDDYKELKGSINSSGLIVPLTVVGPMENGRYQILSGERRYRAIMDLVAESDEAKDRFKSIPCLVISSDNLSEIEQKIIIETSNLETREFDKNAHRMNVVALVKAMADEDENLNKKKDIIEKIKGFLGGSDRYARMYYDIFMLGVQEVQDAVINGEINITTAGQLSHQPESTQRELIDMIHSGNNTSESSKVAQKVNSEAIMEKLRAKDKDKTDYITTGENSPVGGAIPKEYIDVALGEEDYGDEDEFSSFDDTEELDPNSLEKFFTEFDPGDDINQDPAGVTSKHSNMASSRTNSLDVISRWIESMYKKQKYSEDDMDIIDQLRDLIMHVDEMNSYDED